MQGAAPLISDKGFLEAAAGILAVEAYHGGAIRALLLEQSEQVGSLIGLLVYVKISSSWHSSPYAFLC